MNKLLLTFIILCAVFYGASFPFLLKRGAQIQYEFDHPKLQITLPPNVHFASTTNMYEVMLEYSSSTPLEEYCKDRGAAHCYILGIHDLDSGLKANFSPKDIGLLVQKYGVTSTN